MRLVTVSVLALALASAAFAQESVAGQRRENQQERIGNGVANGSLTAGETTHLERQEAGINHEIRHDRLANGGKLTNQERRQINRQQNRMSREIYRDKHNAARQRYGNNEVGARRENQQDRIANGIKSGQLTAGETARLEGHQAAINREVYRDRAANGGRLTAGERARVNRQQNRQSANIYRKKHNGVVGSR
ncbi:MAG TPA: hypothetical protein VFA04_27570 [Bryobacteraceae bacterium]|nr:hypothetical protein [Bryobacteraceae bacterium]